MTTLSVLLSVVFVVSAVIFNFWIIFTYSAPVFQVIQQRIIDYVKAKLSKDSPS